MSTMGPVQGGSNEEIPRPQKPLPQLPTAPSENAMTAPQSLSPKKPLPQVPKSDDEDTVEPEEFSEEDSFGGAKGLDLDESSLDESSTEVENFGGAQGIDFEESSKPTSASSPAQGSQRLETLSTGSVFGRQYMAKPSGTDSQEKKSFSLLDSFKSLTSMVSNSKVGKFFASIGPNIKASAFGAAIKGVFTKREGKSSEKAVSELTSMLSPQSGKTLEDRFRQVFKDPSSRAELEAYCKKNDQMESFNFMERFIHFEKVPSLEDADAIRLHFVGENTPEPINVRNVPQKNDNLKQAIDDKKLMDTLPILRECFTTLANTLYQNMQTSL